MSDLLRQRKNRKAKGQVSNPTSEYSNTFSAIKTAKTSAMSKVLRGVGPSSPMLRIELGHKIASNSPKGESVNFQ